MHYDLGYFDDETLRPLIKKTKNLSVPIEVFYSQRRRHSTLGQISPAEFERRATHAA